MTTRSKTAHFLFGEPSDLPRNQLPTTKSVGQYFFYRKNRPSDPNGPVIEHVVSELVAVWKKASLPTLSARTVHQRVQKLIEHSSKSKRSSGRKALEDGLRNSLPMLFDICACQCRQLSACCCVKVNKVGLRARQCGVVAERYARLLIMLHLTERYGVRIRAIAPHFCTAQIGPDCGATIFDRPTRPSTHDDAWNRPCDYFANATKRGTGCTRAVTSPPTERTKRCNEHAK
jgi:hypothetical protein